MKSEVGKYYKTLDGRKVGPITWNGENFGINFNSTYHSDGRASKDQESSIDLISEWLDETPSPIRTVTRREIVPGVYGKVKVGKYSDGNPMVTLDFPKTAAELREAAHILNQI